MNNNLVNETLQRRTAAKNSVYISDITEQERKLSSWLELTRKAILHLHANHKESLPNGNVSSTPLHRSVKSICTVIQKPVKLNKL